MNPWFTGGIGYGLGLATVGLVYIAVRPTLRARIANGVHRQIQRTHLRVGPIDLGTLPPDLSRVLSAGIAQGVADALP